MVKMHLKRISAPRTWDVPRKRSVFITRPSPGGHSFQYAMSLNTVLKEMLKICATTREVKFLVNAKEVLIDGVPATDEKVQVGLMDVLSFPKLGKQHRMVLNAQGKLALVEISAKDSATKVVRVRSKTMLKGKRLQASLSDGRTVLLGKHDVKCGDSIVLAVPKHAIESVLKLTPGAMILLVAGGYAGRIGAVVSIKAGMLRFSDEGGEHETKAAYAFVVGEKGKSLVNTA